MPDPSAGGVPPPDRAASFQVDSPQPAIDAAQGDAVGSPVQDRHSIGGGLDDMSVKGEERRCQRSEVPDDVQERGVGDEERGLAVVQL